MLVLIKYYMSVSQGTEKIYIELNWNLFGCREFMKKISSDENFSKILSDQAKHLIELKFSIFSIP